MAGLAARQRRFEVILVNQAAHEEKIREVLDAARAAGVPVKRVAGRELDAMAHGTTHGGVLALCSAKPLTTPAELLKILEPDRCPLLLLIEGVEDARNLGFTLRSAEALGARAVLIKNISGTSIRSKWPGRRRGRSSDCPSCKSKTRNCLKAYGRAGCIFGDASAERNEPFTRWI